MGLSRDSRGYALSLDLLLALIPLTIILGMVGADVDNMLYNMEDTVFRGSTDRVANDVMAQLLETSGDPVNWESNGTPTIPPVPGLAIYDSKGPLEGTIDTGKLPSLNQTNFKNLVGEGYGYYFKVTDVKTNAIIKTIGSYNSSAREVVRVERTALYSNLKIVSQAKDLIRYTGTPRVYSSPPDPFPTNSYYLQIYDYWVVVINRGYSSATVNINNEKVFDQNNMDGSQASPTTLKQQIDTTDNILYNETYFRDNSVDVRGTSKPGSSMDVYIVQVPKGTPEEDVNIDSVVPRKVRVELFIWVLN